MRKPALGGERQLVDPVLALRRAVVVSLGYGVAVLTASAATVIHLAVPSVLPDDGAWGSIHAFLRDWPSMFLGGVMITAPSALPGFLVAVAIAAFSGWRDRLFFTFAGGLNAFAALGFSGFLGGGPGGGGTYFTFCCFGGGLAGGYAYWLFAEVWQPPVRFLVRGVEPHPDAPSTSAPAP